MQGGFISSHVSGLSENQLGHDFPQGKHEPFCVRKLVFLYTNCKEQAGDPKRELGKCSRGWLLHPLLDPGGGAHVSCPCKKKCIVQTVLLFKAGARGATNHPEEEYRETIVRFW